MHHLFSPRILILALLLLALEYAFSPFFSALPGRADLLYLLILYYGFFLSWERVPYFAVAVGLLRDFLGAHLFGIETASLAASGVLLSFGIQKFERENPLVRLGLCLLFIGLSDTLSYSLVANLETGKSLSLSFIGNVFWTTIYTTALAPSFFWFTSRWLRRTPNLKQYELFS